MPGDVIMDACGSGGMSHEAIEAERPQDQGEPCNAALPLILELEDDSLQATCSCRRRRALLRPPESASEFGMAHPLGFWNSALLRNLPPADPPGGEPE